MNTTSNPTATATPTATPTATATTPNYAEGDKVVYDVTFRTMLKSDTYGIKNVSFVTDTEMVSTDEKGNQTTSNVVSCKSGQFMQAETTNDLLQLVSALVCGGVPKKQLLSLLLMNAKVKVEKTFHVAGYVASDGTPIKRDLWAVRIVKVEVNAPTPCVQFAMNMINNGDITEAEPQTAAAPTLATTFGAPAAPAPAPAF